MAEKYIIGVDGSEQSRVALDWGLARAAQRGQPFRPAAPRCEP